MRSTVGFAACVVFLGSFVGCTCCSSGYYDANQGLVYGHRPVSIFKRMSNAVKRGNPCRQVAPPVPGAPVPSYPPQFNGGVVGDVSHHQHHHPSCPHAQHRCARADVAPIPYGVPVGAGPQYATGMPMAYPPTGCCQSMPCGSDCCFETCPTCCSSCPDCCETCEITGCDGCSACPDCVTGPVEMGCDTCATVTEGFDMGCSTCSAPSLEPFGGCAECAANSSEFPGVPIESMEGCSSCSEAAAAGSCPNCSSGQPVPNAEEVAPGTMPPPVPAEPAPAPPAETSRLFLPPSTPYHEPMQIPGGSVSGSNEIRQVGHSKWVPRHF